MFHYTRREAAIEHFTTYTRCKACPYCNTSERYVSNSACVCCANREVQRPGSKGRGDQSRKMNAEARRQAFESGVTTYNRESGCPKCNTYLRYTSNGSCVECIKRKSDARYRERAGFVNPNQLPIVPAHTKCSHGALIQQFMPELGGKSLMLVKHTWGSEMVGEPAHYGKCALCQPSRTIQLYNKLSAEKIMPPGLDMAGYYLTQLATPRPDYPHGILGYCMAEKQNSRQSRDSIRVGDQPAQVRDLPPLPPLSSKALAYVANLNRIYDED